MTSQPARRNQNSKTMPAERAQRKAKTLGQYSTPEHVADFMIRLASVRQDVAILDPCCGEGVFLRLLSKHGYQHVVGYEIDDSIPVRAAPRVVFRSFVGERFEGKFDLIIGNPPYVRWKHLDESLKDELRRDHLWNAHFNSLCDYLYIFILKSIELLKSDGELIFITPEYWVNTKHAGALRNYMTRNGYFERIYHFSETPIFERVTSSIIIFKYIKTSDEQKRREPILLARYHSRKRVDPDTLEDMLLKKKMDRVEYLRIPQFEPGERWVLADSDVRKRLEVFERSCSRAAGPLFGRLTTLDEVVDIANGMVSGLDRAFRIPHGANLTLRERSATLEVLKAKNVFRYYHGDIRQYIFVNGLVQEERELRTSYPTFHAILSEFRHDLESRYSYDRGIPYWEWVFPRSYAVFGRNERRIFVPCKERITHKAYFRFCLAEPGVYATQDVTGIFLKEDVRESIYYLLAFLNSGRVFEWLRYKGVVKGGIVEFSERPLSSLPVRLINWDDTDEVSVHKEITALCKEYLASKDVTVRDRLSLAVDRLF